MATISCHDCGQPRTRCPRNTKFCWLCRTLRELDYWRIRTKTCLRCQATFAPLGRGDAHCSTCDPGLRAYSGPCALSFAKNPHEGRYLDGRLPVCAPCARDPKLRGRLIHALENGQAKRIATDYPPIPRAAPRSTEAPSRPDEEVPVI